MGTIKIFNNYLRLPFVILVLIDAIVLYLAAYAALFSDTYPHSISGSIEVINYSVLTLQASIYCLAMMFAMTAMGNFLPLASSNINLYSYVIVHCLVSLIIGCIVLAIIYYFFPITYMSPKVFIVALIYSLISLCFVHIKFYQVIDANLLKRRILVFGAGECAAKLNLSQYEANGDEKGFSCHILGYVAISEECTAIHREEIIHIPKDCLLDYVKRHHVEEVILALEDRRKSFPIDELLSCRLAGVPVLDPVTFLEREQGKVNLSLLHPSWIIFNSGYGKDYLKRLITRSFDVLSSLFILCITLPIVLFVALLISVECGFSSPIFYRQKRIGLDGKAFDLLKFRSMCVDAEKNGKAVWAQNNDQRITRIGKFIRKTRIDELPQILNILKGDMSLVGPRPERPEFVEQLGQRIPYYNQRHSVKPGLAGWAQLKYPYGANEKDAYEKLQYDLYYIKNKNVLLDIFILLQTLEIVVLGKGAR